MNKDDSHRGTPVEQQAEYYSRVLNNLVELGTDIARLLRRQTPIQPAACEQIDRTIRRTAMLARKINAPSSSAAPSPSPQSNATRQRIIRGVEDIIQQRAKTDAEAERLHDEFLDLLEDLELDDDIADRPVTEIVQEMCRDLGIGHSPKERHPAGVVPLPAGATLPAARTLYDDNVVIPMRPRRHAPNDTDANPPPLKRF